MYVIEIIKEFITDIGCGFLELSARFIHMFFRIFTLPFILLGRGIKALYKAVKHFIKSGFREQVGTEKYFTGRIYRSLKNVRAEYRTNPRTAHNLLFYYIRKGFSRYASLVKYLILIIIPAIAAIMTFFTVNYYVNRSVALRIDTGDTTLGYVASESDYLSARNLARERLGLDSGSGDISSELLPDVTYTLTLIDINKFTGTQTLCDRIIENSGTDIVNACGIYIDGEFLCAVKNESDAKRVFNSVLEADPAYGTDAIVTFVQDIDYVEGLYPDTEKTVWEADKLSETVKNKSGTLLTVKTLLTEVTKEKVAFDTLEILSDALYSGTSRTVVSGVDGVAQVTYLVTYINGEKVASEEVSRITLQAPVDKRVQVGTKALDSNYNYTKSFGGMFVWPAVNAYNINSSYGWRWGKLHAGIDIGSSSGTSTGKLIVAAASGTVVMAGYQSSYGYYIRIDHGNGIQTGYAHCLKGSLMVNVGDKVDAGQSIARIGSSGYSTGPHLHFEVIVNGSKVNPAPYLGLD